MTTFDFPIVDAAGKSRPGTSRLSSWNAPDSGKRPMRTGPRTGSNRRWGWLAAILVLLPLQAVASGRFLQKRVHRGDTARIVAIYYYGKVEAASVVEAVAAMDPFVHRRLRPGWLLKLPVAWSYRIRSGDTWQQLGRDFLSAGFRGLLLAHINGKDPNKPPPVGHVIQIPATLWYKPTHSYRIRQLVRWLGPALSKQERKVLGKRIASFNRITGKAVRRNRTILIPLFSLKARQGLIPNDLPIPDPKTTRALKRVHASAKALLQDGRYQQAAALCLRSIASARLSPRAGALLYKDLAHAFVALGWAHTAKAMAGEALKLDPKVPLDPLRDSPKILRLFGARGKRAASSRR